MELRRLPLSLPGKLRTIIVVAFTFSEYHLRPFVNLKNLIIYLFESDEMNLISSAFFRELFKQLQRLIILRLSILRDYLNERLGETSPRKL